MNVKKEATGRRSIQVEVLAASMALIFLVAIIHGDDMPRGDAKSQGFSPEKLERIPALLKEAVEKKQIAGGVALVARRGKIVHVSMAGNAGHRE